MNILGRAGECIAAEALRDRGFAVWTTEEFIRLLELAAIYISIRGECKEEPKEPLIFTVPTRYGYFTVSYWKSCPKELIGRPATPLEYPIYLPCVKKCIEHMLGRLMDPLLARVELLEFRNALKTVDLFAEKDGEFYAIEVKTNSAKLSKAQEEKTGALPIRHLLVRVYLQNPLVEIKNL